jgi:hypothetical protein
MSDTVAKVNENDDVPPSILERMARDCDKAARFYEDKPGLVQPATIVDLYRTIALLARVTDAATDDGDGQKETAE